MCLWEYSLMGLHQKVLLELNSDFKWSWAAISLFNSKTTLWCNPVGAGVFSLSFDSTSLSWVEYLGFNVVNRSWSKSINGWSIDASEVWFLIGNGNQKMPINHWLNKKFHLIWNVLKQSCTKCKQQHHVKETSYSRVLEGITLHVGTGIFPILAVLEIDFMAYGSSHKSNLSISRPCKFQLMSNETQ